MTYANCVPCLTNFYERFTDAGVELRRQQENSCQKKSENDGILSFDLNAAQRVYINLVSVRISEDLLTQKQLLKQKI